MTELETSQTSSMHTDNTTVVDITYVCDAMCRYCRWGNSKTPDRAMQSLEKILIPAKIIDNLGTKRIVLSGGEPTLHPNLNLILNHYKKLVEKIIIITNGYNLTPDNITNLLQAGATGFTISLDTINPNDCFLTRCIQPDMLNKLLANMKKTCKKNRDFEFGINSVVSHVTANWSSVKEMLEFGKTLKVDFIKFQPLFDDGYVSSHSPDLLLGKQDIPQLLEVASKLESIDHPMTNPPGFWRDVATKANGGILESSKCGLSCADSISVRGNLGMCYWIDDSSYGKSFNTISKDDIQRIQNGFDSQKNKCNVDFHCFCNQRIDHVW